MDQITVADYSPGFLTKKFLVLLQKMKKICSLYNHVSASEGSFRKGLCSAREFILYTSLPYKPVLTLLRTFYFVIPELIKTAGAQTNESYVYPYVHQIGLSTIAHIQFIWSDSQKMFVIYMQERNVNSEINTGYKRACLVLIGISISFVSEYHKPGSLTPIPLIPYGWKVSMSIAKTMTILET
ncbi:hypothetical protein BDF20DRAFT_831731 [Mycotypha africana]|uniref:uncharacterized protein n=1 Tax=Mycotypha africana TaxID=64632 RepID=UPI002301849C|nr:uncharacterized protein BDF20DRAFT_831731 [Mycotypha africana]KAI8991717.1 hypothetical protein BDF20DRAFT_831731 [Mycotypha africana]